MKEFNYRHGLELYPDGKRMAFGANSAGPADQRRIFVKSMEQLEAVPIQGTEGAQNPFLSPDGQWLGFPVAHFLPDGSSVLFTVLRYTTVTPDWRRAQVWVKSLKTGERKLLIENALDAIVCARHDNLWSV